MSERRSEPNKEKYFLQEKIFITIYLNAGRRSPQKQQVLRSGTWHTHYNPEIKQNILIKYLFILPNFDAPFYEINVFYF